MPLLSSAYQNPATDVGSEEISFPSLTSALARHRRVILWSGLLGGGLTLGITFFIPATYQAETVILTPQQSQSSITALLTQAVIPSFALQAGLPFRNPADYYVGVLQSRTVADELIRRFRLQQIYREQNMYYARKELRRRTDISGGKDTLIHIKVEDRDPKRAAELANGYVEQLQVQSSRIVSTEASQRRLFYEQQLNKEKNVLADAEIAMTNTEHATGLVSPAGQAEALIRTRAEFRAQIAIQQAQLNALRNYAADDNPRVKTLERSLASLQSELRKLERDSGSVSGDASVETLPGASLEYIRRYREVKYHETLFEVLSKQYEAARLDEEKSRQSIQIVDQAIPPEHKYWPPRLLLTLASTFLAAACSGFWAINRRQRRSL